uniref:Cyclin-dependent kinase 20 n=1 Tax=Sus scrofa TaxID=9823 RepID=A0A4X1T170_PIG
AVFPVPRLLGLISFQNGVGGAFHSHEGLKPRIPFLFPARDGVAVSASCPKQTGEIVALKKVALRRLEDGIPNQALREIKALQEIEDSQYVVQLKAVFPHSAGFVLAFEYMLSDLAEVLRHAQRPLAQVQVKSYLQMLLKGIAFCHAKNNCALGQFQHGLGWDLGWLGWR